VATTATRRGRTSAPRTGARTYDAFISYSHAADGRLAPALQAGLQSLAKPWYRRRALRVFRDQTSLSASPELWGSIEVALSQAGHFVLLASPTAAKSLWVDQEVRWWRANRSHDTVLIALTDGELDWDDDRGDFNVVAPIPPGLKDWLPHEPLWVDLRWARDETDVSMRNPRFRDCVGELAAPMHELPKDELIGEDISQHRRTLRLARGAVALLSLLLILAVVGGIVALIQRNQANEQKRRAQSQALVANAGQALREDPALSTRLAAEAVQTADTPEAETMLRRAEANIGYRTLLAAHGELVYSATFSPDGERVVAGSQDGTARIWDAASGAELLTIRSPGGWVASVAFSPDGERVATGTQGGTIWDAASGAELQKLPTAGKRFGVVSVGFSPDGERVVTATGAHGTATIWDAESGAKLETLHGHGEDVWSAAFSPDGERVVTTGGDDHAARIWDSASGRELLTIRSRRGSASAAFSPDGARVVTAGGDHAARIWDAASGAELATLRGHGGDVNSAAFSPDGARAVTASQDGTARIWDAASGAELATLRGHRGDVNSAAFSPNGQWVVTAGDDGKALIWDATSHPALETLRRKDWSFSGAAFSPDGTRVVTAGTDYSPDDEPFLTATPDGSATLWDAESGAELETLQAPSGEVVASAAFSPDGERLVTAQAEDRTAIIWDAGSGAELETLRGHHGYVGSAAFSPDGERVVTGSYDGAARIWDAESGAELETLRAERGDVESAAFSPDGERILTRSNGALRIWDAASGAELETLQAPDPEGFGSAAFSPDGELVVTTNITDITTGEAMRIWDVASGTELRAIRGQGDMVSAAFSPDGQRIVAAQQNRERTATIWDAASGAELETLPGQGGRVISAAFSPAGERILTTSWGGTARIWECGVACEPVSGLLAAAPRLAGTLSDAERSRYVPE
jgi:WD40 repeat protein